MDFKECMLTRRSIRKFTEEPISDETFREIINAAIYAPSACNFAAWKYIIITKDTPNREAINNKIALNAPYGILVTYRNNMYVTGRIHGDYIQSAAASVQNMLLYINSIGLGACWICDIPKDKVLRKAFSIPKNFDVICYIAIGHPQSGTGSSEQQMNYHYGDEKAFKERKRRYSIDQVLCRDKFLIKDNDVTFAKYPDGWQHIKNRIATFLKKLHLYNK